MLTRRFESAAGWELQNLLTVGELVVAAAWARCETRGVHYRSDYPAADEEAGRRHIRLRKNLGTTSHG